MPDSLDGVVHISELILLGRCTGSKTELSSNQCWWELMILPVADTATPVIRAPTCLDKRGKVEASWRGRVSLFLSSQCPCSQRQSRLH